MEFQNINKSLKRVKLIFNPGSGSNEESPVQLMEVIKEMQAFHIVAEPFLIEPKCDLQEVVREALEQGINMFVVCGGDGTTSSVVRAMIGTNATLGIIPTGTQNNVALSLGIPTDIPSAIALLRTGQQKKVDIGMCTCGEEAMPFVEVCSVGLFSNLFSAGDDIQHGNIARIGDFLATFTTFPSSEIHLLLDDKEVIQKEGHVVMISNMPYVGRHYQVGSLHSFEDGLLDVLFFADLSKLDLISYVLKGAEISAQQDPRIQHYRVKKVEIETHPPMTIMADGVTVGEGSVKIEVCAQALNLIVGAIEPNGEPLEE